jgi:hypothetical protein
LERLLAERGIKACRATLSGLSRPLRSNVWPGPVCKQLYRERLLMGLRQRIRPRSEPPAKMETRVPAPIRHSASSAVFNQVSRTPFDRQSSHLAFSTRKHHQTISLTCAVEGGDALAQFASMRASVVDEPAHPLAQSGSAPFVQQDGEMIREVTFTLGNDDSALQKNRLQLVDQRRPLADQPAARPVQV